MCKYGEKMCKSSVFVKSLLHHKVCMNYYFIFQTSIMKLEMGKTSTGRSRDFRKRQREAGSVDPDKYKEKERKRIKQLCQRQKEERQKNPKFENEYHLKEKLRKRD